MERGWASPRVRQPRKNKQEHDVPTRCCRTPLRHGASHPRPRSRRLGQCRPPAPLTVPALGHGRYQRTWRKPRHEKNVRTSRRQRPRPRFSCIISHHRYTQMMLNEITLLKDLLYLATTTAVRTKANKNKTTTRTRNHACVCNKWETSIKPEIVTKHPLWKSSVSPSRL